MLVAEETALPLARQQVLGMLLVFQYRTGATRPVPMEVLPTLPLPTMLSAQLLSLRVSLEHCAIHPLLLV